MSYAQRGLYMTLLDHAWINQGLPISPSNIAAILKEPAKRFALLWDGVVSECFVERGNRLINETQEEFRAKAVSKSESATNSVRSRYERRTNEPIRAYDSVSLSDSSSSSLSSLEGVLGETEIQPVLKVPDKPIVFAGGAQFDEWWDLWSGTRGNAYHNAAFTTYISLVHRDRHSALMECTASYLASLDQPNKGFRPENFLIEMQRDDFTARFPPRNEKKKTGAVYRDEWPTAAPPQLSPDSEIEKLLAERSKA